MCGGLGPFLFGEPIISGVITSNNYYWYVNATPFVLWFLWIEILFAYVWRKWPIYRAV